ncbi:hypothetical protein BHE74_00054886 [Ensete ventricosum]|nr:hypothetical protein BHE74_00054886 [Ensete ventricosum]
MNSGDLTETVNSDTNPGDLIETVNSGTNPGDLAERVNSGTNPRDLAERANSGINPGDLAERVNSGTNPGDLAERVNSGTNLGDLVERANSGTNPGDLAKRVGMTSSDSSSSIRVVSSPGSGEASRCDPEVNSSGASSGSPSPVDARVLRDLEVMKADHDLDTAFGRSRHVRLGGCSGGQSLVSSASAHRRVQVVEDLPQPDKMDLNDLRGMPKVSGDKAPPARPTTQEVGASPAREALKASSKRPVDTPAEQAEDPTRRHKKVKVLTRRHKSYLGEGESRSRSKGKEPIAPSEESDTPVEDEGQMERAEELDEGLERLVGNRGVQEGTSPPSTSAGALHAPLGGPAGPSRQGNGFGKFLTYALVP